MEKQVFLVLISKNIEEISNEYKEKVIRFLMKNKKKQIMMVEKILSSIDK